MAKFRLSRRAMLRGAGGVAIALPWLEIMDTARASAQTTPNLAKRFLAVYTPGGTVLDDTKGVNKWRPTGTETAPVLSPILAPLEPIKHKLLVLSGLDMTSKLGEQHQAGIIAWMTGNAQQNAPAAGGVPPPGVNAFAVGPSVDQRIARRIAEDRYVAALGKTRAELTEEEKGKLSQVSLRTLQVAVRWGTGKAHGLISPISCANFEDDEKTTRQYSPIGPSIEPQEIFKELFGAKPDIVYKTSILDHTLEQCNALTPQLGTTDRATMQQYCDKVRMLENNLISLVAPPDGLARQSQPVSCRVPFSINQVDTTGYNAGSGACGDQCGSVGADQGKNQDIITDTLIPKVGEYMMDMMVLAMACNLKDVGTFQWTDTEAKHTFPWLNLSEHHHFYQHDGGFRPVECEKICNWYSEMHRHLLTAMDEYLVAPGKTLLDETVVFFGSELSHPSTHGNRDMPFMLAGGGGGLRGGRWLHYGDNTMNRNSHNNLLVSLLNLFGDPTTTFGNPEFCAGPLSDLTSLRA